MIVDWFGASFSTCYDVVLVTKMTVDERWSVFEIECKYLFLSYYIVLNIFTPYHFAFLQ